MNQDYQYPSHLPDSNQVWDEYQKMMDCPVKDTPGIRPDVAEALKGQASAGYPTLRVQNDGSVTDVWSIPNDEHTVGDITSEAIGSGARYNAGKPALELLPLTAAWESLEQCCTSTPAGQCLFWLGQFQAHHDPSNLRTALRELYRDTELRHQFAEMAGGLDYGRRKYKDWNWSKGMAWSVPLACAARHLVAMLAGEWTDAESQQPHRALAADNLLMLATFVDTYPEGNDLPTNLKPRGPEDGSI